MTINLSDKIEKNKNAEPYDEEDIFSEDWVAETEKGENKIKCRDCGAVFYSKGKNALYCPRCALARKKASDYQCQQRLKKERERNNGTAIINQNRAMLEKAHSLELNIPITYHLVWEDWQSRKKDYKKWCIDYLKRTGHWDGPVDLI